MYARAVDEASERLQELYRQQWDDFGLAAVALGLAVAATRFRPSLALPLFFGGLGVGLLGARALIRRWNLLEHLAGERDAYAIAEVYELASREATFDRRHTLATLIRSRLMQPPPVFEARIRAAAQDLDALASELDDRDLELEPACAVACARLLGDLEESPLLNPTRPPEELRSRVRQIRAGFRPTSSTQSRGDGPERPSYRSAAGAVTGSEASP